MIATNTPSMTFNSGWGARDVTCFTIALAVHALLLLWRGGIFTLPDAAKPDNVLVSVDFMSDVPSYEPPAAAAPKRTLLAKMKSLIRGEANTPKPKVDVFAQKPTVSKPDALELAKGQNKEMSVVTAPPNEFKQAQPKLKENTFKMATKDMPFKIASTKDQDALANVNVIPVQVGPKTTLSSRSFDNARMPALQSKTFAGRSGSSSEALAMGSAASAQTPTLNSASTSNNTATSNASHATGREWTSHSGAFAGNNMSTLARNTVSDFDSPVGSGKSDNAKSSNFNITGALAHRPITQKTFAAYEMDARVALRFRVDWSGHVLDGILVETSSGSPTFDQKVVAALKEWTFSLLPADRANEIQEGVITFIFKGV